MASKREDAGYFYYDETFFNDVINRRALIDYDTPITCASHRNSGDDTDGDCASKANSGSARGRKTQREKSKSEASRERRHPKTCCGRNNKAAGCRNMAWP